MHCLFLPRFVSLEGKKSCYFAKGTLIFILINEKVVVDPEGLQGFHLNHPLRQNYFFFMGNFKKN